MTNIHITIERERDSRPSREGARFRVKLRAQPGGPALMMSTRLCQSVAAGKRETEALFGSLDWRDAQNDVRSSAILEIEADSYDPSWCYTCDRPQADCGCVENGGNY